MKHQPQAYAEFAVRSNFSFLDGASRPEELVVAAELHGYGAIGLADRNTVAGVVRAWQQAKAGQIPFHPGARARLLRRNARHAGLSARQARLGAISAGS